MSQADSTQSERIETVEEVYEGMWFHIDGYPTLARLDDVDGTTVQFEHKSGKTTLVDIAHIESVASLVRGRDDPQKPEEDVLLRQML